MDEKLAYYRYKHTQAQFCWLIINIVLTIAYIIEYFKGLREMAYLCMFFMLDWAPYLIYVAMFRLKYNIEKYDVYLEYFAGTGYLAFYTFVLLTGNTLWTISYIFPMLCILTAFHNKKLSNVVMFTVCALVILKLAFVLGTTTAVTNYVTLSTDYEIIIACLVLCAFFQSRSNSILQRRDKLIINLHRAVNYDMLTKIYNRQFIVQLMNEWSTQDKYVKSVAIIDIDAFKSINDTYGHKAGDEALIKLAELMSAETEGHIETYPVRLGGDEFVIISSTHTGQELYKLCESLKKRLEKDPAYISDINGCINMTLSVGVVEGQIDSTFDDLYSFCDKLLYKAKKRGKDMICASFET